MITFEESILITIILENIEQELSLEETSPHPQKNPFTLLKSAIYFLTSPKTLKRDSALDLLNQG